MRVCVWEGEGGASSPSPSLDIILLGHILFSYEVKILVLLCRLFGIISRVSSDQETPKLVCRVIEAEISGAKVMQPTPVLLSVMAEICPACEPGGYI